VAAALATIFDSLRDLSDSPVFYLVILIIAVLDSVFPIVPSETMVIIGGVAAGLGDLNIAAVIAVGAAGAFIGDNMSFEIGLRAKAPVTLITARFIPGGRTLLTLSCGITGQPHRWFARWVGAAAIIWASYAALLGYVGGKTFEDNHTLAFVVAFTTAVSITVLIEVVRHFRKRRA
jgi:membrane protein DedA with SNARE-associated domain